MAAAKKDAPVPCKVIAENGLNLRQEPRGAILGILPYGLRVSIVELKGQWAKVQAGGKTGWVMVEYLSKEGAGYAGKGAAAPS